MHAGRSNSIVKVIAKEGNKLVKHTMADDGEWLSLMICINAADSFVSNLCISKRKTKPIIDYIQKCEPNAAMSWQDNGYMTAKIFLEWLKHFQNNVPGGISR